MVLWKRKTQHVVVCVKGMHGDQDIATKMKAMNFAYAAEWDKNHEIKCNFNYEQIYKNKNQN